MKKKILALGLCVAMLAIAVIGGSLAYFTDTDAQENVFTVGNVKIDLYEDFGDNDGIEKLIPTTGKDADGNYTNAIEKEVYVENVGSEKAYVRVHIAIPQILDNGYKDFDASENVLHFNYSKESIEKGKWNWSNAVDDTTGNNWNFYTAQVDGIWYNVYVVTYETVLERGDITVDAMSQVYLDSKVTNEDVAKIKETLGDDWKIYVVAEAGQADGFTDAYTALNTQFGEPGEYNVTFDADAEQKLYVDDENSNLSWDVLYDSISASGVISSATEYCYGNKLTLTATNVSVEESTNPNNETAYWLGTITFTAPDYANVSEAKFTRDGSDAMSFDSSRDGDKFMNVWLKVDEADKDVYRTYTFDWDGDGVYEAIYEIEVTNVTLVKPVDAE